MSELNRPNRRPTNRRAVHGQALIIVLAVLFVLLFIGTIFIAEIARNISTTGRSGRTQIANNLAEAGIRYCDSQLTNSPDGADWRPIPTPPISLTDPDYNWLATGFTRISMNGGRVLVRIVYNPALDDPHSGMLRIEAVGRPGEIGDGSDPTVFVQTGTPPRLRKELIAYKAIGLTDSLLYITDKNHSNTEAAIGVPDLDVPLSMVFGDPATTNTSNKPSGGIRSNAPVKFYGSTYLYLSERGTNNPLLTPEGLLVAGDIAFDSNDTRLFINRPIIGDDPVSVPNSNVLTRIGLSGTNPIEAKCASNPTSSNADCQFDGSGGLVRDGSDQPDKAGYTRGMRRLEPPSLDYADVSGVLRFHALTRESGLFAGGTGAGRYNTGQYGWGTGIYVNNPADYQPETNNAGVGSSYSLRADWLNPKAGFAQNYWNGPHYRPPGVLVELLGNRIRLVRDDSDTFYLPNGQKAEKQGSKVIEIPLSDFERQNFSFVDETTGAETTVKLQKLAHDGDEPNSVLTPLGLTNPYMDKDSYGVNVVVYAEGNVRVRGVYGAHTRMDSGADESVTNLKLGRVHLTIVTRCTAYIEGNIVKGDGYVDASGKVVDEKGSTCAILAHDYVCVNTTMFLAPQNQTNAWAQDNSNLDSFVEEIGPGLSTTSFDASFSFGIDPIANYDKGVKLLVRHASYGAEKTATFMNLRINKALSIHDGFGLDYASVANTIYGGFYRFNQLTGLSLYNPDGSIYSVGAGNFPYTYSLGYTYSGTNGGTDNPYTTLPYMEQRGFPLDLSNDKVKSPYEVITAPGYENLLSFSVDTSAAGEAGTGSVLAGASSNYAFGGAVVTPMDIRIEALLYAQERSFFVIPGYPFNPDPQDTRQNYLLRGLRSQLQSYDPVPPGNPVVVPATELDFPFYNEPLDVRITVYGGIAENYTASVSDQAAWMARWGYIRVNSGGAIGPTVPDIHLRGVDDVNSPKDDYRTKPETSPANPTQAISRGLRFLYDPSMAMPYFTGVTGYNPNVNQPLRFINPKKYISSDMTVNITYTKQVLPMVPRLPVCPGLLYFGDSDRPIR